MDKQVVISGFGCVSPLGNNVNDLYLNMETELKRETYKLKFNKEPKRIKNFNFYDKEMLQKHLRLDIGCQYLLESTRQALLNAGIRDSDIVGRSDVGVIIGTTYGLFISQERYLSTLYKAKTASPILFMQTANNLFSGILSYKYKIKGYSSTIFNGWTAGLDAIMIAEQLILSGNMQIMIVGGIDTLNDTLIEYLKCKAENIVTGEWAGDLILQSKESAMTNQNSILGYIKDSHQCMFYSGHDLTYELTEIISKNKAFDYYLLNKNGCFWDKYEINALERLDLLDRAISLKPIIGECGAATGIFQIIFALNLHKKASIINNIGPHKRLSWVLVEAL